MKILSLIVLASCSLFKGVSLTDNVQENLAFICLQASGEGQIRLDNQKYPFNYETGIDEGLWIAAIQFPFKEEALFEVDLERGKYRSGFEAELLKSIKGVDPQLLNGLLRAWSGSIQQIYRSRHDGDFIAKGFKLKEDRLFQTKEIRSGLNITFSYFDLIENSYFKYQSITLKDNSGKQVMQVQSRVRECLKKPDNKARI